jgi:hypothetical protein
MKNNLISESDITEILSMHKSLKEQNKDKAALDLSSDLVQLRKAITAGCLKGGKILTNDNQTKYVYRATSKSGKIVDFTADMNYKFDDGSKTGKWKCDEIAKMEVKTAQTTADTAKKAQSLTDKIAEYKLQRGAQEYKDILYKNEANDPTFYQKIPVEGVETGFLYIPKKDKEYLNTNLETKGYTEAQKDVLSGLTSQQFVLNPTPLQRTAYQKVKFDANSEELQGLFPNGIVAYIDPKNLITDINPKVCKEYINQYWESYRDDDSGNVIEFTKNKAQVMACKRRYYPNRWGLLGLAGNQIDKKIDVLSRKANEYDGLTTPSRTSKWLLN